MGQGAAVLGWTASAVISFSTQSRLAETRSPDTRRLCETIRATPGERWALNQLEAFDSTTLKEMERFMLSTVSGKDDLEEETGRRLWRLIFNAAAEAIDKPDRDRRTAR